MLFFLVSILTVSCGKDVQTNQDEKITLSFSIVGADIIETEVPFNNTKSSESEETTYVIGVYEYNSNTSDYEIYACGSFDTSENISIQVTKNKVYKIKVALFKDFFNSGQILKNVPKSGGTATVTDAYAAENKFEYNSGMYRVLLDNWNQPFSKTGYIFPGETFYGEIADFTAAQGSNITINLSRVSTFVEIKVNGMTEGKVESITTGLEFDIEYPNDSYSTWITSEDFKKFEDSFMQNLYLRYVDPQNNITTILNQTFTFKNNYKKTIILNLTKSTPSELSSDFSISVSNSPLLDDGEETHNIEI